VNEGDVAPLFASVLHTGERFALIDYRGRKSVVLFFYPRDFTTGCTAEACALRDNADRFAEADAVVAGVSYDNNDAHARFGLAVPLIADADHAISRLYGAERFVGRSFGPKRMTVVIDKEGVIKRIERAEFDPEGLVIRALRLLQGPAANRGE
jgi:peroxiredoxin Q/BCP